MRFAGLQLFENEIDNGNSGTSKTIDCSKGNAHKLTLTGACSITLTAPPAPGFFQIRCIAGGGAGQVSFATAVNWFESASVPTTSTTSTKVTIYSLYYDGAAWYGSGGRYNP